MPVDSNTADVTMTDRQSTGPQPDFSTPKGGDTPGGGSPPTGPAGGDLSGTYPNPNVAAIHETGGPTKLTIGAIADGKFLKRSGATLIGADALVNPMTTLGDIIYGASAGAATRLAGNTTIRRRYLGQTGTGAASAAPAWANGPSINVTDWGVVADSTNDQSALIDSIIGLFSNWVALYFPGDGSGNYYRVDGLSTITGKSVAFRGDGTEGTVIKTHALTGPIIATSSINVSLHGLQFGTVNTRTVGNPILDIAISNEFCTSDIVVRCTGDAWYVHGGGFWTCVNVFTKTLTNAGIALKISNGGVISNSIFNSTANLIPSVYVTGASVTSLHFNNCHILAGGPLYSWTPSAVTGDGTTLTVTTSHTTGFSKGGIVILKGFTSGSAVFNGFFRITAVTANTSLTAVKLGNGVAVPSATATVGSGVIETVPCCMHIDNLLGAVNECQISNTQFGAQGYPTDPLSCAIYFDGVQTTGTLEGWILTGNYYDYGAVNIIIVGGGDDGVHVTTFRININGGMIESNGGDGTTTSLGSVWILKSPGIVCTGIVGPDVTMTQSPKSSGVYIYSDSDVKSDGCIFTGCYLGCTPQWNNQNYGHVASYGLTIDGLLGNIQLNGNIIWGQTNATQLLATGVNAATIIGGEATNTYLSGTSPVPDTVRTPFLHPLPQPFFSVFAYGARGDGAVDDTAAINAALTAAGVAGGKVWLGTGARFKTTATLQMPSTNFSIVVAGSGTNGSVIVPDYSGGAFDVFKGAALASVPQGYVFEDFGVQFGTQAPSNYIFNIPSGESLVIRNVTPKNFFSFLKAGTDGVSGINRMFITDIFTADGGGVFFDFVGSMGGIFIQNIYANALPSTSTTQIFKHTGTPSGGYVPTIDGMVVRDCDFELFTKGFLFEYTDKASLSDAVFENLIVYPTYGSHAFSFKTALAVANSISNVRIRNCLISTDGAYNGINLDSDFHSSAFGVSTISVEGNHITAPAGSGIYVGAATDINIVGNTIYGSSKGIRLASTSGNTDIEGGNRIGGILGANTTGIQIDSGALTWFISGNDVSGNTTNLTNNGGANDYATQTRFIGYNQGISTTPQTCRAVIDLTSNQTLTTGVEATLSFSSESYDDTAGLIWASGDPTKIKVPSGAKRMKVEFFFRFAANATGGRAIKIKDNAGVQRGGNNGAACPIAATPTQGPALTAMLDVVALSISYFTITATQDSGGNLDVLGSSGTPTQVCVEVEF